jgi:DNA-binding transcriptional LysR family regulator
MNLLHLEYFYYVAKEGGFLRASERLRIQQPAISRMVKQLEEYFGFKLFEKIGRQVKLTSRGHEVYESCKKIFGEVDVLKKSVGKIRGECKGPLLMAASEPIASHFLPKAITALMDQHPKIYPQIFSGTSASLLKQIENGDVELGFFFHIPHLSDKLVIEETMQMNFRLVIRKDLKKNRDVLHSFIGSREIDDESTRRFPTLEKLRVKYPEAKISISSNNLTAHKELVLLGKGVAVLPEFLIAKELKTKELVDVLPDERLVFSLKIIKRKHSVLSLNATELLKTVALTKS